MKINVLMNLELNGELFYYEKEFHSIQQANEYIYLCEYIQENQIVYRGGFTQLKPLGTKIEFSNEQIEHLEKIVEFLLIGKKESDVRDENWDFSFRTNKEFNTWFGCLFEEKFNTSFNKKRFIVEDIYPISIQSTSFKRIISMEIVQR